MSITSFNLIFFQKVRGCVVYGKLETTENKTLCAVGARNLGVKLEIVDTTAAPALYIVGR